MTVSNDIAGHQTTAAQAGLEFGRQSGGHGAVEGRQGVEEVVYERVRDRLSEADRLLRRIDSSWSPPPFDPILVAQVLGIRCVPVKNPSLHQAMIMMSDGTPTILYRQQRCPARTRYNLFHEIAHTLFPDYRFNPVYQRRVRPRILEPDGQLEYLCDLAASEFMMPMDLHRGPARQRLRSRTSGAPVRALWRVGGGRLPAHGGVRSGTLRPAGTGASSPVAARQEAGGMAARAMSLTPGGVDLRYTTPPPPHPSDRRD